MWLWENKWMLGFGIIAVAFLFVDEVGLALAAIYGFRAFQSSPIQTLILDVVVGVYLFTVDHPVAAAFVIAIGIAYQLWLMTPPKPVPRMQHLEEDYGARRSTTKRKVKRKAAQAKRGKQVAKRL